MAQWSLNLNMRNYIYTLILCYLAACTGFKDAALTEEKPLVQLDSAVMNAPSLPVMQFNGGIFYDKHTDLSKWEGSHANIGVQRKGNALVVNLRGVGVDWEMLSRKFFPLDVSAAPYLLMKARAEGDTTPVIRIDLVDEDGLSTNFVPQQKTIAVGKDSVYKFVFENNFIQNWPFRGDVNPRRIVEIKMNFNGGGPNYTGRVLIEELKAVSKEHFK